MRDARNAGQATAEVGSGETRARIGPVRPRSLDPQEVAELYRETAAEQPRRGAFGARRRLLRIGLPAGAFVVMTAIFLSSAETPAPAQWALIQGARLHAGSMVVNPRFSGETEAGDPFFIQAEEARPDAPDPHRIDLDEVLGEFTTESGREISISAATGVYRPKTEHVRLERNVVISTDDGYALRSETLQGSIEGQRFESDGRVDGSGPLGELVAGRMRLTGTNGGVVYFDGGVLVTLTQTAAVDAPLAGAAEGDGSTIVE